MVEPKFKIGFEFQENNRLCKWAADIIDVQKKPILTVYKGDRKLWSLEIDTMDFEFITPPFANYEVELLRESIETILLACKILQNINDLKSQKGTGVSLDEWLSGIGATDEAFSSSFVSLHKACEDFLVKKPGDANVSEKKSVLENACNGLQQQLSTHGYRIEVDGFMHAAFREAGRTIALQTRWKPTFQPQVTIQHSLQKTIPLIVTLFGPEIKDLKRLKIVHALPSLAINWEEVRETSSKEGFIFLHALTCAQLVNDTEQTEGQRIAETCESFEQCSQVDAKVKLHFLSRRPFSKMWHEIKEPADSFASLYSSFMKSNALFLRTVPRYFPFINYAEEYYEGPNRADLSAFKDKIRKGIFNEAEMQMIESLLKIGILSTSIIRNLEGVGLDTSALFQSYFDSVVQSVDSPSVRHEFDLASRAFRAIPCEYDA